MTGISKTPDLVTSLEPVPLLGRARGTTRESLIEGVEILVGTKTLENTWNGQP